MIRLLTFTFFTLLCYSGIANNIIVSNEAELVAAEKQAKPGDVIVLKNGEWKNIQMSLQCNGTQQQPITFKAQTGGKVVFTGLSSLAIGGEFIVIDGFCFTNGYAGKKAVIEFRAGKNAVANNCRVTNCMIRDFNNPKRMDENNWVLFYGKHNRVDHCSFINKTNMGVLMAVILDDDRSRENFHQVDNNYFGIRLPLGSNGGEIIRVGVSQHCQFNSNTLIADNCFDRCDGEAEVISIKSCSNVVRNNVFRQCQGSVVLRHGNDNLVENNIFLGAGKEGTGGVRVINRGQWVINNYFDRCRGTDFRSPLTIMNGIPNSPAHRYVQVTNAVIANNTFVNCSPASFCEGSDTERTLPPANVALLNNAFYNTNNEDIYKTFDDISGIHFSGNSINSGIKQKTVNGFMQAGFATQKSGSLTLTAPAGHSGSIPDSLQQLAQSKLHHRLSVTPGFSNIALYSKIITNANNAGPTWNKTQHGSLKTVKFDCKNSSELRSALNTPGVDNVIVRLTSSVYHVTDPIVITKNTQLISAGKQTISFKWPVEEGSPAQFTSLFEIKAGAQLKLSGLRLDFSGYDNTFVNLVGTDNAGNGDHSSFILDNCSISNMKGSGRKLFRAQKSTICDSVVITNSQFDRNEGTLFSFSDETDKKGYYNVERLVISGNSIRNHSGPILEMLRGGNDESTMGPKLIFTKNAIADCHSDNKSTPLLSLTGTQVSFITDNTFQNCNPGGILLKYEDFVRAKHLLKANRITNSGDLIRDKFVTE